MCLLLHFPNSFLPHFHKNTLDQGQDAETFVAHIKVWIRPHFFVWTCTEPESAVAEPDLTEPDKSIELYDQAQPKPDADEFVLGFSSRNNII